MPHPEFGGEWTEKKLTVLEKYMKAYTTALKNQNFTLEYIDAFAGTGYRQIHNPGMQGLLRFEEAEEKQLQTFREGSIIKALGTTPGFDRFCFVEKDPKKIAELTRVCAEFPEKNIDIRRGDANYEVQKLCEEDWISRRSRAVLFLDPFGLQVTWETLRSVATTHAIDLWLLFPIGSIIRMLSGNGQIDEAWCQTLDRVFGDRTWYESFYKPISKQSDKLTQLSLFESSEQMCADSLVKNKTVAIGEFFRQKLGSIFEGVASNPLYLRNSRNFPLYLLCFAASNKKGATVAIRIAEDILGKELA